MIDRGVNPYVVDYSGRSQADVWSLSNLSNLPSSKSIFFSIESFECSCDDKCSSDLSSPWFYKNGVFDGRFDAIIGKGTSVVLHGFWHGIEAAFKFVPIQNRQYREFGSGSSAEVSRKIGEMKSVQTTAASKIVKFYGHYR